MTNKRKSNWFQAIAFGLAMVAASILGVQSSVGARQNGSFVVASSTLTYFDTEDAAQAHCPNDVVVWLNIQSGIYHYKGERWYGKTKHGAYVCEKEAIAAGDRASENGQ